MVNLRNRSEKKELLDQADIPFADIRQNMQELNTINTFLGGHAVTIAGLKKLLSGRDLKKSVTICELGCGGGDNLMALSAWCTKNNVNAKFIGIDIKDTCITFAQQQCSDLNAAWITADYATLSFDEKPDVIFSSLFCHHFSDTGIVLMLQWMKRNAAKGFFINDLHRHPVAFYAIQFITAIFSNSYLVKNDAPLSVARGFEKTEWQQLLQAAAINSYSLQWKWAFRHLIVCRND